MGAPESHRHLASKKPLRYLVVTVSTSRYAKKGKADDQSGDLAQRLIEESGGKVASRELVSDDKKQLKVALSGGLRDRAVDVVVFTGGTGVSTTDVTVEVVRPYFEKEIEGFGEIFRLASYQKIGAAAALTRATAGVVKGKVVMCLPGAPDAVKTALDLFLPELPHVVHLARGR